MDAPGIKRMGVLVTSLFLLVAVPLVGWCATNASGQDADQTSSMTFTAQGHSSHDSAGHNAGDEKTTGPSDHASHGSGHNKYPAAQVRVDEQLGGFIDFSARLKDENNQPVDLKSLFGKPVVLLPVYFSCTSVCSFLQAGLANVLNRVSDLPGRDFNVISLSFSDDEGPDFAQEAKQNYTNLIKRDFSLDHWTYLTGDRENILKVTDSLGYYFAKRKPHLYVHPNAMVILAKDGKIIRYLYGPDFLPFDVGMALSEARKGEPGISIKRGVLSFCFDYDPENKTYVFKLFRITGTAILILLAGFILFLVSPSKKGRRKRRF